MPPENRAESLECGKIVVYTSDKSIGYDLRTNFFQKNRKKCLTAGRVLGITTNALRHSGTEKAPRGREERSAEELF